MGEDNSILTISIDADQAGSRLDKALASLCPSLSRERVKALILDGKVTDQNMPVRDPARKVEEGQSYNLHLPPPPSAELLPQDISLSIAYEDDHLIVVNKPAGMVVHPAAGNEDGTLVNALLHHCGGKLSKADDPQRPGIVHRIDKDTSGLLVIAKSNEAHDGLVTQFKDHSISRRYLAITFNHPRPVSGTVTGHIGRSDKDRKKMAVLDEGRGKHAVTHYRTLEVLDKSALVECRLETGRTHQVRVHMSHIGHPLLGDPVYGVRQGRGPGDKKLGTILRKLAFDRQALHAASLGFIHPVTGEKLAFEAPLPDDMQHLLSQLRLSGG